MPLPAQSTALADHSHPRSMPGSVGVDALDATVYGGTPTSIDPDDTAAAGTAATVAHSDHQHAATCGIPDALTLTATSAENTGVSLARNNHTHATSALPWGVLANGFFTSTASDTARAAGVNTDMTVTVALVNARMYGVHVHGQMAYGTNGTQYALELKYGTTIIGRVYRWNSHETTTTADDLYCDGTVVFRASANDAAAVLTCANAAGSGGTLQMVGVAGNPRTMTVYDMGPG